MLLSASLSAGAQTPADFFHMGATNYCRSNYVQARKDVTNGLTLYPNNPWLTNLWELLNRQEQQQQQQQQQNKDQDKDQQSKDQQQQDKDKQEQQKQDEQKKQEEQKNKEDEQKKKEEEQKAADQQKKDGEDKQGQQGSPDQQKEENQDEKDAEGRPVKMLRMTPQQAMQLLDMLKSDEKNMPFRPILRTNKQQRVFKDW